MNQNIRILLSLFVVSVYSGPKSVSAHGTEEEHQRELLLSYMTMYSLVVSSLSGIVFLTFWVMTRNKFKNVNHKSKEGGALVNTLKQKVKLYKWLTILSVIVLLFSVGLNFLNKNL